MAMPYPPQNYWQGNLFQMPQYASQRYQPGIFGASGPGAQAPIPAPIPLTAQDQQQGQESEPYASYGQDIQLDAGNRFGEVPLPGWARAGIMGAGMAIPPLAPFAMGANALMSGANVMANNKARDAIGLEGLDLGQMLGGMFGLNPYGRGLDPVGESAAGTEQGYMNPSSAGLAAPNTPTYAQDLGVANVPGGAGTGPTQDESSPYEYAPDALPPQPGYDVPSIFDFGQPYRTGGGVANNGDGQMDEVPAILHEGEFVLRPEAVKKYGRGLLSALNEGRIPPKKLKGLFG